MKLKAYLRSLDFKTLKLVNKWIEQELDRRMAAYQETMTTIEMQAILKREKQD